MSNIIGVALDRLNFDGGFTINPFEGDAPTTGYMVSLAGAELARSRYDLTTEDVLEHFALAGFGPGEYWGGWVDSETETVYLDVSRHFADLDAALDFGRENRQLAIWDVAGQREIRLDRELSSV